MHKHTQTCTTYTNMHKHTQTCTNIHKRAQTYTKCMFVYVSKDNIKLSKLQAHYLCSKRSETPCKHWYFRLPVCLLVSYGFNGDVRRNRLNASATRFITRGTVGQSAGEPTVVPSEYPDSRKPTAGWLDSASQPKVNSHLFLRGHAVMKQNRVRRRLVKPIIVLRVE